MGSFAAVFPPLTGSSLNTIWYADGTPGNWTANNVWAINDGAATNYLDMQSIRSSQPITDENQVASGRHFHEWDLSVPSWAITMAPDGRHVVAAQRDGITVTLRLPGIPVR
jgi:hypothetical protein